MNASNDDPIEQLLKQAGPRPVPPPEDGAAIKTAVHAEWQDVVQRRNRTRGWRYAGLAAALVAAAALGLTMLAPSGTDPVTVAHIDRSAGAVYVLGDRSELRDLGATTTVRTGQVIQTDNDGALGLRWANGGSLRLDERTRVEFVDATTVRLARGRLYFDSGGGDGVLNIATALGSVSHLGTQYMVAADDRSMTVSVREGEVRIDGRYHDAAAIAGKQLSFRDSAQPVTVDLAPTAGAWSWAESVAPHVDLDGLKIDEFLQWFGRETGYRVEYATDALEAEARREGLSGASRSEQPPRTELRRRMLVAGYAYELDDDAGVLRIGTVPP